MKILCIRLINGVTIFTPVMPANEFQNKKQKAVDVSHGGSDLPDHNRFHSRYF
jgi:hypothetical protein